MDKDMVIVRPQATAENGEIVAALIDNEATVKRFHQGKDGIVLEPANPDFSPLAVDTSRYDFRIIGTVVGLLRDYK